MPWESVNCTNEKVCVGVCEACVYVRARARVHVCLRACGVCAVCVSCACAAYKRVRVCQWCVCVCMKVCMCVYEGVHVCV